MTRSTYPAFARGCLLADFSQPFAQGSENYIHVDDGIVAWDRVARRVLRGTGHLRLTETAGTLLDPLPVHFLEREGH